MPKTAIVTDSNSGIFQKEAALLGDVYVIPMPFTIDDETYFEDINLTIPEFYERLNNGADILTSQPSPDSVLSLWDKLLKDYDELVYIPMSSGLSSSCQTATMFAMEYDGRVQVVNNQRVSVPQRQSVLDALELSSRGKSALQIKQILEKDRLNHSIYIMLDTLTYLKKGGRITPAAASLGTLLRIKPVLQIQGEKLDAFAKARTTSQGKSIMLNAIRNDLEQRFGGVDSKDYVLQIAHTQNEEAAMALKEEMTQLYPGINIYVDHLALSIACHTGPGALGVGCCKKLHYDEV